MRRRSPGRRGAGRPPAGQNHVLRGGKARTQHGTVAVCSLARRCRPPPARRDWPPSPAEGPAFPSGEARSVEWGSAGQSSVAWFGERRVTTRPGGRGGGGCRACPVSRALPGPHRGNFFKFAPGPVSQMRALRFREVRRSSEPASHKRGGPVRVPRGEPAPGVGAAPVRPGGATAGALGLSSPPPRPPVPEACLRPALCQASSAHVPG